MREMWGSHRHHGGHDKESFHYHCWWGEGGTRFARRFITRQERIARLEEYLKELQAEVRAVEERIAEMR